MSIYDIDLYQSQKEENVDLLKLTYHMNLPARIDSTIDQISSMPVYKKAPFEKWRKEMKRVFPNVKKGNVSVLKTHDIEMVFFHKGKYGRNC